MARKPRSFVDEDLGLVKVRISSEDTFNAEQWAEYARIIRLPRGLDAMVKDIKATWLQLAATLPVADENDPFSLRSVALEIPFRLSVLQAQVRQPSSTLEDLIVFALLTGQVMTEGRFRLQQVPTLRLGRKRLEQLRMAGQESGRERRDRVRERDAHIQAACQTIRTKHPYDRQYSTRWLVTEISRKLRRKIDRAVLRRLNLK